jgi:CrcB protein
MAGREPWADRARVVGVVAAGGMLGAAARHGVGLALPTPADGVPWSTLLVNVSGCVLIGVLMILVVEVWTAHPLVRPFLGVGLLGGYTTFSTAAVDAQQLIIAGRPALALGYTAGTAVAALVAVQVGMALTRAVSRSRGDGR